MMDGSRGGNLNGFKLVADGKHVSALFGCAEAAALIYARMLGPEASAKMARKADHEHKTALKAASEALTKEQKKAQAAERKQAAAKSKAEKEAARIEAKANAKVEREEAKARARAELEELKRQRAAQGAQHQRQMLREAAERQQQQRAQREAASGQAQSEAVASPDGANPPSYSADQPVDAVIEAVLLAAAGACPYARLGMRPHAPREACRRSYLQLALKLHPDKCSHPQAKEAFAAVEAAFRAIDDAASR